MRFAICRRPYSKLCAIGKAWKFFCAIAAWPDGMIIILSALVCLLSFRFRNRAALELELVALRHQVIIMRGQHQVCPRV